MQLSRLVTVSVHLQKAGLCWKHQSVVSYALERALQGAERAYVSSVASCFPSKHLHCLMTFGTLQQTGLRTCYKHDFELHIKNCIG